MEWYLIVVLVFAIPLIFFPAAYVWYLNVGGVYSLIKQARERRAAERRAAEEAKGEAPAARRA